jgi:hypothetical protein
MQYLSIFLFLQFFIFFSGISNSQWIQPNDPSTGSVHCFIVNGNNIYAGVDNVGIYLSTNEGTNWTLVNNGLTDLSLYSMAVCGSNIFAGTHGGVFKTTDNGSNWAQVNNGLNNNSVVSLAVSGNNIFAGTAGDGVYLSTNNGLSWAKVNNGLPNGEWVNGLTADGNNIYAGVPEGGSLGGVYLTTNNGTSWKQIGLSTFTVYNIAVSGNYIFASTAFNGVYLSTNGGDSWAASGAFTFAVYNFNISGTKIFAGSNGNGVYLSTNYGSSWTQVGLNSWTIYSLISSGDNIFAGTNGYGIWRSPLSELTAITKEENNIPREYILSRNFPNPFNPSTTIKYSIPQDGMVNLAVYNSLGQKIAGLVNQYMQAGNYEVKFNASSYPSGIYFYRLEAGNFTFVKKMILMK